jgi:hypothetical protein
MSAGRAACLAITLLSATGRAAGEHVAGTDAGAAIHDPPAVQVFPVHEAIGERQPVAMAVRDGRTLFAARFNVLDGAGRPFATGDSKPTPRGTAGPAFQRVSGPDANSCFGCHNLPEIGGSGDIAANVFFGAQFADPIVESIDGRHSNERHTPSLFGSGIVETLAREMTEDLHEQRAAALRDAARAGRAVPARLRSKGVGFGHIVADVDGYVDYTRLEGVDTDLVVKPFGVKGVAISLREFSIAALNHHHGMQAIERFGWERTGVFDFDHDGRSEEFSVGQLTALVLFQASLPAPPPADASHPQLRVFEDLGCAGCHVPSLPLRSQRFSEPNPYNRPGTLTPQYTTNVVALELPRPPGVTSVDEVRLFSDLRRHVMCDQDRQRLCNEELKQDNVPREQFMTARLWDLATSAPYCHRGDCATVTEAIEAHGGEGRAASEAFQRLPPAGKRALIGYLLSLGVPQPDQLATQRDP